MLKGPTAPPMTPPNAPPITAASSYSLIASAEVAYSNPPACALSKNCWNTSVPASVGTPITAPFNIFLVIPASALVIFNALGSKAYITESAAACAGAVINA